MGCSELNRNKDKERYIEKLYINLNCVDVLCEMTNQDWSFS